jgi:hypothetical protein
MLEPRSVLERHGLHTLGESADPNGITAFAPTS